MSAKKATQKSAKSTTASGKKSKGFTAEERAAMKERAQELKAEGRRGPRAGKADGESDVLAKIAEMPGPDRAMAKLSKEELAQLVPCSPGGVRKLIELGILAPREEDKPFRSSDAHLVRLMTAFDRAGMPPGTPSSPACASTSIATSLVRSFSG